MTKAGFDVVWAVFDPTESGYPNARERFYESALNLRTLVRAGSSPAGNVRNDFLTLSRPLTTDGYFVRGRFRRERGEGRRVFEGSVKPVTRDVSPPRFVLLFVQRFQGQALARVHGAQVEAFIASGEFRR